MSSCIITDNFNPNMILSNKSSAKHIPDKSSSSKKKRGRPVGVKNKNNSTGTGTTLTADTSSSPSVPMEKQPGDVSFPLSSELVLNHHKIRR